MLNNLSKVRWSLISKYFIVGFLFFFTGLLFFFPLNRILIEHLQSFSSQGKRINISNLKLTWLGNLTANSIFLETEKVSVNIQNLTGKISLIALLQEKFPFDLKLNNILLKLKLKDMPVEILLETIRFTGNFANIDLANLTGNLNFVLKNAIVSSNEAIPLLGSNDNLQISVKEWKTSASLDKTVLSLRNSQLSTNLADFFFQGSLQVQKKGKIALKVVAIPKPTLFESVAVLKNLLNSQSLLLEDGTIQCRLSGTIQKPDFNIRNCQKNTS